MNMFMQDSQTGLFIQVPGRPPGIGRPLPLPSTILPNHPRDHESIVSQSPCIMCVQYRGGAQYRGGCSVPWGIS